MPTLVTLAQKLRRCSVEGVKRVGRQGGVGIKDAGKEREDRRTPG